MAYDRQAIGQSINIEKIQVIFLQVFPSKTTLLLHIAGSIYVMNRPKNPVG